MDDEAVAKCRNPNLEIATETSLFRATAQAAVETDVGVTKAGQQVAIGRISANFGEAQRDVMQ